MTDRGTLKFEPQGPQVPTLQPGLSLMMSPPLQGTWETEPPPPQRSSVTHDLLSMGGNVGCRRLADLTLWVNAARSHQVVMLQEVGTAEACKE